MTLFLRVDGRMQFRRCAVELQDSDPGAWQDRSLVFGRDLMGTDLVDERPRRYATVPLVAKRNAADLAATPRQAHALRGFGVIGRWQLGIPLDAGIRLGKVTDIRVAVEYVAQAMQ